MFEKEKKSEVKFTKTNAKKWHKEYLDNPKERGENFRRHCERVGVPTEHVKEFKYWLREQD